MSAQNLHPEEAIAIFRDYTSTLSKYRQEHRGVLAISTGYPIENALTLSPDMLKTLCPIQAGKEIDRFGYGWNFDGVTIKKSVINYENTKQKTKQYTVDNVALTMGGTHGLNQVVKTLTTKGKKRGSFIAIAPTFFRLFGEMTSYVDIIPVYGDAREDFVPSFHKICSAINNDTIAIFICNPSNPVYKFFPGDLLNKLIIEAEKRNIYIVIDEVGDTYRYDLPEKYSYPPNITSDNVIRVCSASKLFLMAEYRVGYVIANPDIAVKVSRNVSDNVSHINYSACSALKLGLDFEAKRLVGLGRNSTYSTNYYRNLSLLNQCRAHTVSKLKSCSKVSCVILPDACFSLVFQVQTAVFKSDIELYKSLMNTAGVSIVPGSGFGIPTTEMWFRLTYAYPIGKLRRALNKLINFLESHC